MAYNDNKIFEVLSNEISDVPERCYGYHKELLSLLKEVIRIEQEHLIARTNVVTKITDQVNRSGRYLYDKRADNTAFDEDKR